MFVTGASTAFITALMERMTKRFGWVLTRLAGAVERGSAGQRRSSGCPCLAEKCGQVCTWTLGGLLSSMGKISGRLDEELLRDWES